MKRLLLTFIGLILFSSCVPYTHYLTPQYYVGPTPVRYSCHIDYYTGYTDCNVYVSTWVYGWGHRTWYSVNNPYTYYGPYWAPQYPPTRGRVVNGRGYTRGTEYKERATRTNPPRTATPRTQTQTTRPPPERPTTRTRTAPESRPKPTVPVRRRGGG